MSIEKEILADLAALDSKELAEALEAGKSSQRYIEATRTKLNSRKRIKVVTPTGKSYKYTIDTVDSIGNPIDTNLTSIRILKCHTTK